MNMQDTRALDKWLRSGATLASVEKAAHIGLLGNERFSPQAVRAYRILWEWSALRLSSSRQEQAYRKIGQTKLMRRIERCNRWIAKFRGENS